MDFLNTSFTPDGAPAEAIGDGRSFIDWLVRAALLDADDAARWKRRFHTEALDAAAAEARKVRQWVQEWISKWRDAPAANYEREVRRLNALIERASSYRELVVTKGGLQMTERLEIGAADDLIALVAAQIAMFIVTEQPTLVKRCAGPTCTLWFLDRTKAHRRLFCSAAACGNRAKVAAFRKRQRAN
ncbi:MAG: CGNR zinc finger domain-containing protein [Chthoniobacterales bacterium]|nr:CGNR zinc finger domain-containing protein [Chthoniobacterales bacterium]